MYYKDFAIVVIMVRYIVGIDEVGRGPIAGPVAVCVCAIKQRDYVRLKWNGLTDSKKMTARAREQWFDTARRLKQKGILVYTVVYTSASSIDKKGISWALRSCVIRGLQALQIDSKGTVLLDGSLKAPKEYQNQKTIIKGDQKEKIISLASVIAKVSRDHLMKKNHKKYPQYDWDRNKGYGTPEHYRALARYGMSSLHRKSFLTKKEIKK